MFGANLVIVTQIYNELSPSKSIPVRMFGANLVILTQICNELSRRQAKCLRILSQNGQNDLQDQGQWPPFSTPSKSIPVRMFGANLVILTQNL